jgi:hypothetical protein
MPMPAMLPVTMMREGSSFEARFRRRGANLLEGKKYRVSHISSFIS